jgi:hypothetical protein
MSMDRNNTVQHSIIKLECCIVSYRPSCRQTVRFEGEAVAAERRMCGQASCPLDHAVCIIAHIHTTTIKPTTKGLHLHNPRTQRYPKESTCQRCAGGGGRGARRRGAHAALRIFCSAVEATLLTSELVPIDPIVSTKYEPTTKRPRHMERNAGLLPVRRIRGRMYPHYCTSQY